jgi:CMP/dCMP kinase
MIIAVDGPAASGKSTIAQMLADKLGFLYIDTGAMYRAVTLAWLQAVDSWPGDRRNRSEDEILLNNLLDDISIKLEPSPEGACKVLLNGKDVSKDIRTYRVSNQVSYVSTFKSVREKLVSEQRKIAEAHDIIMDGRDIGTVVFPQADLKIFMLASVRVRARRRYKELIANGEEVELDQLILDLERRDKMDSEREESPLRKSPDAIEVNTDDLSIEDVFHKCLELCTH